MKKGIIDKLCETLNRLNGLVYPMAGYVYFADVKGDGQAKRKVYMVMNDAGGVSLCYNGATYRQTADNIRKVLPLHWRYIA